MIEIDGSQHSGSGATIDRHASDRVIPFASLAAGTGRLRVPFVTGHTETEVGPWAGRWPGHSPLSQAQWHEPIPDPPVSDGCGMIRTMIRSQIGLSKSDCQVPDTAAPRIGQNGPPQAGMIARQIADLTLWGTRA